ncbi:FG-GAP and VCBS repeat-containing protein [Streptomyces himalayensis]|uniref:FG-GAP repeat protein n=1 Tax=Streptomyces himalayensis subsp. himalayensis TaxID=2756131 RepID=A0A7W0I7E8_9ACTN|nr:FG-GAP and VCBS repeat-containing protein [Streptomyces himalayensis]MBA2945215.1 FG-GAP repeat protein [Streptomyces himalayensis subsp. himalayensis]
MALAACGGGGGGDGGSDDQKSNGTPPPGKPAADPDPGDFNGDGYDDYIHVVTATDRDRKRSKTTLVIVYGSKKGLNTDWAVRIPEGSGSDAWFTGPLLRADLDGDGFTDLVGSRGPSAPDSTSPRQQVFVMYGGARGLDTPKALDVPQGTRPLAVADFDGDGSADVLDAGTKGSGPPMGGTSATSGRLLYGPFGRSGKPERTADLDLGQHGYAAPSSATTGDFDADGRAEVVLTYSFDAEEDETAPSDLHTVAYYEGSEQGLVRVGGPEARIAEAVSTFDGPRTPATGDADGDGTDDLLLPTQLAVAPADMPGTGGALTIMYGAKSGLGTGREATVIAGKRRIDFGSSPAVGDVNGDKRPDVVVNTPDFRRHDGKVTLLPGSSAGVPSATGEQSVDAETAGLPGTPNPHYWNAFNHQPPLLDVDGDGRSDVIVFGPLYEKRRGAFLVLRGTEKGLDPQKVQFFTPADIGVSLRLT